VAVDLLSVHLQDLEVVKLAVAWATVGGLLGD
jgi:hypothetical protein